LVLVSKITSPLEAFTANGTTEIAGEYVRKGGDREY
jgi:hypothetical protein